MKMEDGKDPFKEYLRNWWNDKEIVREVLEEKKKIWEEIKDDDRYNDFYKRMIKTDIERLEKRLKELEGE